MKKLPPLVMIHGLIGSQRFYRPEKRIRAATVHSPSLIGYGEYNNAKVTDITLEKQVAHVVRYLSENVDSPCVLLGHSVGGAVAMLVAAAVPERVRGIINVEGNFTLADAFWCRKIASQSDAEWHASHEQLVSVPENWLKNGGVDISPQRLKWAYSELTNQPRETIQAMACTVLDVTGGHEYLAMVRKVIEDGTPLYLLAGERSAPDWDLPDWVKEAARDYIVQSGVGHMMMLEEPDAFCRIVDNLVNRLNER